MSTAVKRATVVVTLMPSATMLTELSRVPVDQDTPEMESHVQVCETVFSKI